MIHDNEGFVNRNFWKIFLQFGAGWSIVTGRRAIAPGEARGLERKMRGRIWIHRKKTTENAS